MNTKIILYPIMSMKLSNFELQSFNNGCHHHHLIGGSTALFITDLFICSPANLYNLSLFL